MNNYFLKTIENQKTNDVFSLSVFYFFTVLALLPSVTFSIVPAEIFPWALMYAVIYIRGYDPKLLFFVFYLAMSALYAVFVTDGEAVSESVRSIIAYLNVLIVFSFLLKTTDVVITKVVKVSVLLFFILVGIGIVQNMGFASALDPLVKLFIPRGNAASLGVIGGGGRGVTLLSNEPARAGVELLFLYTVVRTVFLTKKTEIIGDVLIGLLLLLLIKSATCMAFYAVYIGLFYRNRLLTLIPLLLLLFLIEILFLGQMDNRFTILAADVANKQKFDDMFFIVSNNSGHRVISIISGYYYGVVVPFGGGVGNWMNTSIEALNLSGIDLSKYNYFKLYGDLGPVAIRFSGFVTNLIIDIGLVGVLIFMGYIYSVLRKYWQESMLGRSLILLFLAKIMFFGSVGNPVAWITTVICLRYISLENNKIKFKALFNAKKHGELSVRG